MLSRNRKHASNSDSLHAIVLRVVRSLPEAKGFHDRREVGAEAVAEAFFKPYAQGVHPGRAAIRQGKRRIGVGYRWLPFVLNTRQFVSANRICLEVPKSQPLAVAGIRTGPGDCFYGTHCGSHSSVDFHRLQGLLLVGECGHQRVEIDRGIDSGSAVVDNCRDHWTKSTHSFGRRGVGVESFPRVLRLRDHTASG